MLFVEEDKCYRCSAVLDWEPGLEYWADNQCRVCEHVPLCEICYFVHSREIKPRPLPIHFR